MASLLLARHGIASRVVERRAGPHRAPQAHVVNPRTLEICRAAGIDMDRAPRAWRRRARTGRTSSWMTTLAGEELGRLPYERQGDDVPRATRRRRSSTSRSIASSRSCSTGSAPSRAPSSAIGHEWQRARAGRRRRHRRRSSDLATGARLRGAEPLARSPPTAPAAASGGRSASTMIGPDRLQSFVMIHFEATCARSCATRPGDPLLDHRSRRAPAPSSPTTSTARGSSCTRTIPTPSRPRRYDRARCAAIVRRAIGRDDVDSPSAT